MIILYVFFIITVLEIILRMGGFFMLLNKHHLEPNPNEFRILAIGESTTFGLGVDNEKAYPKQLEFMLNNLSNKKFVVINVGIPSQTSTSILRKIESQLDKYRPDLVVSIFGVVDYNNFHNKLSSRLIMKEKT